MKKYLPPKDGPKILLLDIETAPVLGYVWGLWENNLGLNQVKSDWFILSWSAKWLNSPPEEVMYADQRKAKVLEDDTAILKQIWDLLNECDVVITQNGRNFDQKKLNARFIIQGFKPTSSYKHIDTFIIAKKHFGFTSNKLEYMSDKLCKKYKKLKHEKFSGFEMWSECLKGNQAAWKEMEKYNKYDVLSLEELYKKLIPWSDDAVGFDAYRDDTKNVCRCGNSDWVKNGYFYTSTSKFQRYKCKGCSYETRGRTNLLSKEKKASLRVNTRR